MTEEVWKPVVGYEGLYEVSNLGRVMSLGGMRQSGKGWMRRKQTRLLGIYIDRTSTGYWCCTLCKDGIPTKYSVHVLVLEAFVGPRPSPGHEACHDDGNRANAALSNLRWDTASNNHADKVRHGTHSRGERAGKALLTNELAQWIRESPQSSLKLAPILGVASSTIRAVRIGQNWNWQ